MKLAYRDVPAAAPGRPAIVLHDRGMASVARLTAVAQASGAVGPLVAPFGDYGFTASGMELAGICWYRTVPGFTGGDPLTLAKAVVQVGDLLDDVDLDGPALLGWGEGAVVALGAALLRPDRVASVICIDARASHLDALPAGLTARADPPPVLLMGRGGDDDAVPGRAEACIGRRGVAASTWEWPAGGSEEDRDKAIAERIGRWLGDG